MEYGTGRDGEENDLLQTCVDLDLSWKAEEEEEELPESTRSSYLLVLDPLSHSLLSRPAGLSAQVLWR